MSNGSSEHRSADLVLSPNEYAYISDRTKGHVNVYVGPHKTSLADTDQPVIFDYQAKRFRPVTLAEATQTFQIAPEGWYISLKNPSKNIEAPYPSINTISNQVDLDIGRKVNIPGPVSFALYPGQMAKVVPGHNLKSNEYLLARVYDDKAAKKNWKYGIIKSGGTVGDHLPSDISPSSEADDENTKKGLGPEPSTKSEEQTGKQIELGDVATGDLLVIKGTEISFFIPPTGIEVLKDDKGNYIREAVTLERLEYCILLGQNGNKRYERGPKVVFPDPTESFLYKKDPNNSDKKYNKFRAFELNENSGIYIKVIADYEENNEKYAKGDELFITGEEQKIYFPREEHAIIKYGDEEIHYGIAIPNGEARYVLNRSTGEIRTEKGPQVFLPDPRKEVIVKRVLDEKTCRVMFPGNAEALQHNKELEKEFSSIVEEEEDTANAAMFSADINGPVIGGAAIAPPMRGFAAAYSAGISPRLYRSRGHAKGFGGDSFNRKSEYTKPRTITLNTKYDGAVTVEPWTGYAVMVVDKSGNRRVEVGPKTIILKYDENLQIMEMSTGTPKSDKNLLSDVYLRTMNNKVSDLIEAETNDFCRVNITLSYRVNFEGEPEIWFNVENYVKFLTDHMRSKIRNAVMRKGIEDFYRNSTDILRDTILGPNENNERPGMFFKENGMRIYDVEILDVELTDMDIQDLLISSQRDVINQTLRLDTEKRNLIFVKETEQIKQEKEAAIAETRSHTKKIQEQDIKEQLILDLARIVSNAETVDKENSLRLTAQETIQRIKEAELSIEKATEEQKAAFRDKIIDQSRREIEVETEALVAKMNAISPDLIAALQAFSNREMIERVSKSIGPAGLLDLLGGKSIADILARVLEGTELAKSLPAITENGSNGKTTAAQ